MSSEVGNTDSDLCGDCYRLKYAIQTYGNPVPAYVLSPYAQLGSNMYELSLASPAVNTEIVPPNSPDVSSRSASPIVEDEDSSDTERSRIINSVLDLEEEMFTTD